MRDGVQPWQRVIRWHVLEPTPSDKESLGDDVVRDGRIRAAACIGKERLVTLVENQAKALSA